MLFPHYMRNFGRLKGHFPPPFGLRLRRFRLQSIRDFAQLLSASHAGLICFWGLLLVSASAGNLLAQEALSVDKASVEALIQKLERARDEIAHGFLSVSASGKLSGWVQTPGKLEPKNSLEAEFLILRDGPRFHLQLLHAPQNDKSPPEPQRLEVAVFDGKTIYTFSSSGTGQERGGVFFEFSSAAVLRSMDFPFSSLLNFWDDAVNLKELDQSSLSITDLGRTGLLLKEDRATYTRQIYLGKTNPLDIQRVALRHPNASVAFREHWLSWQAMGDQRYVQHYVVRHRYAIKEAPEGQIIARQYEIDIESFSPNTKHADTAFTLEGLGVPPGTVFVDYRRNVKGRRVTMIWNGKTLEDSPSP